MGRSSSRYPRPSLASNSHELREKALTPWNSDAEKGEDRATTAGLTVILKLGGHSSCRSPRPSLASNFLVLREKVLTPWNLDAERVEEELEG